MYLLAVYSNFQHLWSLAKARLLDTVIGVHPTRDYHASWICGRKRALGAPQSKWATREVQNHIRPCLILSLGSVICQCQESWKATFYTDAL